MVTSDQIVGRPRTECAVTSILTESATTPVNWYTSVIVQIKQSQKVCRPARPTAESCAPFGQRQNPVPEPMRSIAGEFSRGHRGADLGTAPSVLEGFQPPLKGSD